MTRWTLTSTRQSYTQKPRVSGVVRKLLKGFPGSQGDFYEITRSLPDYQQLSYASVLPGVVKAFHVHKKQTDMWVVLPGCRGIIGLYDSRLDSITYGISERIIVNTVEPISLLIPPGVAHGIANPYQSEVHLIYLTDKVFDPEDEFRLPWDYVGASLWEIERD